MPIERAFGPGGVPLLTIDVTSIDDRKVTHPARAMSAEKAWRVVVCVTLQEDGVCVFEKVRHWRLHAGPYVYTTWVAPGEIENVTFYNNTGYVRIEIRRAPKSRKIFYRFSYGRSQQLLAEDELKLGRRHGKGWPT